MRRFVREQQLLSLLGFLAASYAAAGVGSAFTLPRIPTWYRQLRKPRWTPPRQAFGPVWSILYTQMAVAAWLIRRRSRQEPVPARRALAAWVVQLALNTAWSAAFFGRRSPLAGLVVICNLWLAIVGAVVLAARTTRPAAVLLLPYLAWTTFAAALNVSIWQKNRR